MNPFLQQMINHKLNTLSAEELIALGSQYNIQLTDAQAAQIIRILRQEKIDVSDVKQRDRIIKRIEAVTSPQVAQTIQVMFQSISR
ncbi:DUF2624 family protein [Pseudalkalibacillus berkeleyi]|uniref:DUF2624 domain-containing protein n=1 Tax=Pseudalkalibacillus berkeleyi TaxID=1069813 RepID=A0ABS9GYV5_9BACL|nr:DUF2624 family protein [Pseudalkalibacillus berkeleyi]MCF6137942.1 DUF2624 domain-containing protein [Pseudalkalibacillus berkeleyi]